MFVIEYKKEIVGFLEIIYNHKIRNNKTNNVVYGTEINMLYIIKEYRHKKIATNIIVHLNKTIHSNLLVRCEINNSKEAIQLFKKLGYQDIGFNKQSEFILLI